MPPAVCKIINDEFVEIFPAEINSPLAGSRIELGARNSEVRFLDSQHWIAGLMKHFIWQTNLALWNLDLSVLQVVQLTSYEEGGLFSWHKDTSEDEPYLDDSRPEWKGLVRKLSATMIINDQDNVQGGDLQIKDEYGFIWRDPAFRTRGSVVVFPSNLIHQVTPVTQGCRRSVVAWALGPPLR